MKIKDHQIESERLNTVEAGVSSLQSTVSDHTIRIGNLELDVSSLEALLASLENEIESARGNFPTLKAKLDYIMANAGGGGGSGGGGGGLVHFEEITITTPDTTTFTMSYTHDPAKGRLLLFRNGILLREGTSNDYTVNGSDITVNVAAQVDELFTVIVLGNATTSSNIVRNQVTKLGVVASPQVPKIIDLQIEYTSDFNRLSPEVLKFVPAQDNVVTTICEFNNADASDFQPDPMVEFDGVMRLKTVHVIPLQDQGPLGSGRLFSAPIDISAFKVIEKVEVTL